MNNDILDRYGALLQEVDGWFAACQRNYPQHIQCAHGCHGCCRGLFDITILDAYYLASGVATIAPELRRSLRLRAAERLAGLSAVNPCYQPPWFLNHLSGEEQERLMPEDDPVPCLLLSPDGSCLLYRYRPMTCRLHGIPLFDVDGEPFSDEWCSLNFIGSNPEHLSGIRFPFRDLFTRELHLFRELTSNLYGKPCNELDLPIPAALLLDVIPG